MANAAQQAIAGDAGPQRLLKAVATLSAKHFRRRRRMSSLERDLAELRGLVAAVAVDGSRSGTATKDMAQATLIRSAHLASEIDRLNLMYESLAVRMAQDQAGAVPRPVAPALHSPPMAPPPPSPSGNDELSEAGEQRWRALLDQYEALLSQIAPKLVSLGNRLRSRVGQPVAEPPDIAPLRAHYSQVARQYAIKVEAAEQLATHNKRLASELAGARHALDRMRQEEKSRLTELAGIRDEHDRLRAEQERALADLAGMRDERDSLRAEQENVLTDLAGMRDERGRLRAEHEKVLAGLAGVRDERDRLRMEQVKLLADSSRQAAELGQTSKEYARLVAAQERMTNQAHEILRNLQQDQRSATFRPAGRSAGASPATTHHQPFPSDIAGRPGVLPIRVVDVGAQSLASERHVYAPLQESGGCTVTGFEPLAGHAEQRAREEPGVRMLPYAIGRGGAATLRITRFDPASSLLAPDLEFLRQFMSLGEMCEPAREMAVETRRLDDIGEISECDFLKLDVQGGERDVLEGARGLLERVVVVHTEVAFAPIYRDQPLFADIDTLLRSCGFELMELTKPGFAGYRELAGRQSESRLMWCDAVYFKQPALLASRPDSLLKGAYIAHVNYGLLDLAAHLLAHHDRLAGTAMSEAYVTSL